MKKLISTFMTVALLICCFTATAFASNQTVLTTTVPDATYTLNIPADQEIGFGQTTSDIGMVTISDASGFAAGKNVTVIREALAFVDREGHEKALGEMRMKGIAVI